ncbi:uncharacterized protein, partial [Eucyclogobius newberryi]|uniref:uncharacterized protein n=1 Tax=Eucyclogobius newberryi TaxID=166745 RepID=UPI003B5AE894
MSKDQTLRTSVTVWLTATAERTIVENEEELCDSKQENQRKQELLDSALKALSPRVVLNRHGVQLPSLSSGPDPKQEIPETPLIKEEPEEQSIKQEEEQLQISVPESSAVCVKTEEPSLHQQTQIEPKEEETQGDDVSSEPHFHSETEGDTEHSSDIDSDEDWRAPLRGSAVQEETEADGEHYNQIQIRSTSTAVQNSGQYPKYKSAPGTS